MSKVASVESTHRFGTCYVSAVESTEIVARTVAWVRTFVIAEGLCPFAGEPLAAGQVRFSVSQAHNPAKLLDDLILEIENLQTCRPEQVETTLLIHPHVLGDFDDYLAFIDHTTVQLREHGLEGIFQIAGFHPLYQFADTSKADPANATNRSPYPMLHILREASVSRAVDSHPDPEGIWRRNVAHLRAKPVT